jgi:rod shape-determining protein MreD
MGRAPRRRIDRAPTRTKLIGIPVISVMLASLSPLLPMVATFPILPPFGFLHRTLWPVWAAVPLGLFDDLFSGQPLGSAMLLWTLAFFALDLFDRRMIWRDVWQDWGLAAGLIVALLYASLLIANMTGGTVAAIVLIPQIILSILLFPAVAKVCALLNRVRLSA